MKYPVGSVVRFFPDPTGIVILQGEIVGHVLDEIRDHWMYLVEVRNLGRYYVDQDRLDHHDAMVLECSRNPVSPPETIPEIPVTDTADCRACGWRHILETLPYRSGSVACDRCGEALEWDEKYSAPEQPRQLSEDEALEFCAKLYAALTQREQDGPREIAGEGD